MKQKETPEERFKRLVSKRTNKILKAINVLGNCSNRQVYSYTEMGNMRSKYKVMTKEDIDRIVIAEANDESAWEKPVKSCKYSFL